jgi:hypothetical protein
LNFLKWLFFYFYASYWLPLPGTSHAVDCALWGLNPWGHLFVNNVFHALNTFLAVIVVIKLLEAWNETSMKQRLTKILSEREMLAAGTVSVLFGLHPLHVESAVWVAESKDLLCALFFFLSIISYTWYVRSEGHGATHKNLASIPTHCLPALKAKKAPRSSSEIDLPLKQKKSPVGRQNCDGTALIRRAVRFLPYAVSECRLKSGNGQCSVS